MNPSYPVYVISKGRWESRLASRSLERLRVPYRIVVEPQEQAQYEAVIDPSKVLVLPFSNLGQGSIPARNWVWEHALSEGAKRHWILDDNIQSFYRLNDNNKIKHGDGTFFKVMEDFSERYDNVALSGPHYEHMRCRIMCYPAYQLNSRVYSCILILNSLPFRWRVRYNEDTDLSLRALKAGWCTILFNAFLQKKIGTMRMKGGNTEELYKLDGKTDGRLLMAQSLKEQHPDVTTITRKWGRWQHQVNYGPFRGNKLIKKEGLNIPPGNNEYGMKLIQIKEPLARYKKEA
jgi:hypothetical protein